MFNHSYLTELLVCAIVLAPVVTLMVISFYFKQKSRYEVKLHTHRLCEMTHNFELETTLAEKQRDIELEKMKAQYTHWGPQQIVPVAKEY